MIVFLGIVGELATVIGGVAITLNAGADIFLESAKNGYKIDRSVLDEIQKKNKQKITLANNVSGTILALVPGVNLIIASIQRIKHKKAVMNDPLFKEAMVPMTEKEKKQYEEMEGKLQKLNFIASITPKKNKGQEIYEKIKLNIKDTQDTQDLASLYSLYYEELMPLDYTLDEVKRLNEATTYSYRIGKIDGKNVAVIGIPSPDRLVSRIRLKSEDYKIIHTYEKMTEEEAQDKTFTVYPFTKHDDTQADLEKVIQEIKQSRIKSCIKSCVDSAIKTSLEELGLQPRFEQEIIPTETEDVLIEEQQGLVLERKSKKK